MAIEQGRLEEAESLLRDSLAIWSRAAPDAKGRYVARIRLAQVLMRQGRVEEACRESSSSLAEGFDLGDESSLMVQDALALRTRCSPPPDGVASSQ